MSAVLVDVYKTQSFHCKKEQNVQIKSDIKYISCGTDAENLTIKAFFTYWSFPFRFSWPLCNWSSSVNVKVMLHETIGNYDF